MYNKYGYLRYSVSLYLVLALISTSSLEITSQNRYGPLKPTSHMDTKAYIKPGDINIASFVGLTDAAGSFCLESIPAGSITLEYSEVVAFAVKLVNENSALLPNVTLGFVVLNDCNIVNSVVGKSFYFLPRVSPARTVITSCDATLVYGEDANVMPYYDVIGVIGPTFSQPTVMMTQILNVAGIPVVGTVATSDSLSDKSVYPNFVRVIPPDKYQVEAMLKFAEDNSWSYISVIYEIGSYGENAFETIKSTSSSHGICIATSHRTDSHTNYDDVMKDLLSHPHARVVILFTFTSAAKQLFKWARYYNASGHFIWLGSEGVGQNYRTEFKGFENEVVGMFSFTYYSSLVADYYNYLRKLDVVSSTNPWLKLAWENLAGCSLDDGRCDPHLDILQSKDFVFYEMTSNFIDAVLTFAHGAHDMLTKECPNAIGQDANFCLKNQSFINYLKNVSFSSYNGRIKFNSDGDAQGLYNIYQIVLDFTNISFVNRISTVGPEMRLKATYDIERQKITSMNGPVSWNHLRKEETVVPLADGLPPRAAPESVCSRPCVVGEYKIQKEPECCWECRECRENERLNNDNTGCERCAKYMWPDPNTDFKTCLEIPLTYQDISDTLPLIQICLGVAALICAVVVVFCYVYFRDVRVIKAASKELSILQMGAIFLGYLTVILLQATPTPITCGVRYFSFCLSFTWLYAPLLVKVIRIYRIFESGTKSNRRPRFVSPQSQLILTAILIAVQLIICAYIYAKYRPTAIKIQPVLTEKFVELSCIMTIPGLTSFLAYNLVLVCLCSVFAFKTRALPDNFNESRFISMCVSTTLIIWLAFITTYFTTSRGYVRALVVSMTLLLNHTVAIIFLYLPKIYAAVYVPSEKLVPSRFQSDRSKLANTLQVMTNRVGPVPSTSSEEPRKY